MSTSRATLVPLGIARSIPIDHTSTGLSPQSPCVGVWVYFFLRLQRLVSLVPCGAAVQAHDPLAGGPDRANQPFSFLLLCIPRTAVLQVLRFFYLASFSLLLTAELLLLVATRPAQQRCYAIWPRWAVVACAARCRAAAETRS